MIILACDGCGVQSPNERGERIADDWTTVTVQSQRQRDKAHQGQRLILCECCFPKMGSEDLPLSELGLVPERRG